MLNKLQFDAMTPWDNMRHDFVTHELALHHMKKFHPKFTYISYGETDDWAHEKRYDRYVQTLHLVDKYLKGRKKIIVVNEKNCGSLFPRMSIIRTTLRLLLRQIMVEASLLRIGTTRR